jgi:hypothetical protein
MTLDEGIELIGSPAIITGCSRNMLPEFFKSRGFKVGAEIGVREGLFSERFCKAGLKMYCIDPWLPYSGAGRTCKEQSYHDRVYQETKDRLSVYGDLATIIRKTSMDAVKDFRNRSLDFVYIDGNHHFLHAVPDMWYWSSKVKSGGIVSGHDYFDTAPDSRNSICHVKTAVDAYVKLNNIENWWIIERLSSRERQSHDDNTRSWMWIKK